MTLFEQWKDMAYDTQRRTREQVNAFWDDYFQKEKNVYSVLLETPDQTVTGSVKDLAERFSLTVLEMVGFLDGINDSLVKANDLDALEEDTVVSLDFDNEKLYRNMVDAGAEWLYGLPQWDAIYDSRTRKELYLDQKKSHTIHVGRKIGRNDPCPCGSGKKYKFCHGKKGAEPLPE